VRDDGDGRGRWGTARVMSHDAITIGSEVYDFNLGSYRKSKR